MMSPSTPPFDIEVPGHRLVRRLGRGGMATVYLAIQSALRRPVAVKVLHAPNEEAVARFEQEARTIARLDHPNIVSIHQIGRTSGGQLFYTMPYLPNGDLSRRNLRQKPLRVAAVLRALLDALGYAHAQGIVHRDIKPENVLFDKQGRALLADFGIARTSGVDQDLTREGAPVGSIGYMSPEQARGQVVDGRSDLYSLGVLAYEMLTGELPFAGSDALSTAIAHIEQKVPRLPPMVRAWQPWIDKALAKTPGDRFQNAAAMADTLGAIDGHRASTGQPPSIPVRLRIPATFRTHRREWVYGAGGVAVLILLTVAVFAAWNRNASTPASVLPEPSPPAGTQDAAIATVVPEPSASAVPAAGSTSSATERAAANLVAEGDALRAQWRITSPPRNNAAVRYIAALKLDPDNAAALGAVHATLAVMQPMLDSAWKKHDPERIEVLVRTGDQLAAVADAPTRRDWKQVRTRIAAQVGVATADAVRAGDAKPLAIWKPLARKLPAIYPPGFDAARIDQPLRSPEPVLRAGMSLRDAGGPTLVYVAATDKSPAFAIQRDEITRREYAEFARATHRPPAACLEAHNPFSRLRKKTWQSPGFAQSDRDPAICVSWNDAVAYAAWLSERTGQPYRLPDDAQWLRTARGVPKGNPCLLGNVDDVSRKSAIDNDRLSCNDGAAETAPVGRYAASGVGARDVYGNVSEWLAGGGSGERRFRGLSWRDGSNQTPLGRKGDADANVGYTSVGFRLVREINAAHPPPH